MKAKLSLLFLIIALASCKSTTPVVGTKLDMKKEVMLKGNWIMTNVDYPGKDYFKTNVFYIADSQCFVNSNWSFISNNNKGEMKLNSTNTSCPEFNSPITWYINKEGQMVLKITNGHKAKMVKGGHVLRLKNVTENTFELAGEINVAGSKKDIIYSFHRSNN